METSKGTQHAVEATIDLIGGMAGRLRIMGVIYLGSGFLSRKDCCNSLNKLYVTQV